MDRHSAVLVPLLLLVGGALHTAVTVASELIDDHGRVVTGADGQPVLVTAAWETWKMNGLPNVLFAVAAMLLLRMFYQEVAARHFRRGELTGGTSGR